MSEQQSRLTERAFRELEEREKADRRVWELMDIIVAEWMSDSRSVQCFDLRVVLEAADLVRRRKAMTDPFNPFK